MEKKEIRILKCVKCGAEYIFERFSTKCSKPGCGGAFKEGKKQL